MDIGFRASDVVVRSSADAPPPMSPNAPKPHVGNLLVGGQGCHERRHRRGRPCQKMCLWTSFRWFGRQCVTADSGFCGSQEKQIRTVDEDFGGRFATCSKAETVCV